MAYIKPLFNDNFLHYASYVIKDRAIPELLDGLKPVQRRIMHTLFESDDGKFHKVANIVGACMKYHPHGDASIYSALVVLANKDLFIDKQGNFGNILTGDEASAARYIECKASAFAKEIFYNPKTTEYIDSYDGRNKEPTVFPAKIPVVIITGAEGIAVGMSTKILPHNPVEVIQAEIAALRGKKISLFPDFPTAGIVDGAEYQDGLGKIRVRATLDTSDPKRIIIRDLPYGISTESLIESIESAAKAGRVKIASISDYTTDAVEIEIKLARGVYSEETVEALYAFTQCEVSISCNLLVIKNNQPALMTLTEIINFHAEQLLNIFKAELNLQIRELLDEIHIRTLERIFIEERVYKLIENKKTESSVQKAVFSGLEPFTKEIKREITEDDVNHLLRIHIRRISLYDISKAKDELDTLLAKLKKAKYNLQHLTEYTINFLESLIIKLEPNWKRKTKLENFNKIDVKEVARRDIALRYDEHSGYVGTGISGGEYQFDVSTFDRILIIRRNGIYSIVPVPEKLFVDKGLLYVGIADKDILSNIVFSAVYVDSKTSQAFIKRCTIDAWIVEKDYQLVPDGVQIIFFTAEKTQKFTLSYAPKPRCKILEQTFKIEDYAVKGPKTLGLKLSSREVVAAKPFGLEQDDTKPASTKPPSAKPASTKQADTKHPSKKQSSAKPAKASAKALPKKKAVPTKAPSGKKTKAKPKEEKKESSKNSLLAKASEKKQKINRQTP